MKRLGIHLLGGAAAAWGGGGPVVFPTRKSLGLLAYVAVNAARPASRSALANLYWAEAPENDARASLRRTLYELTTALGEGADRVMEISRESVSLVLEEVVVDVLEFEAACRADDLASLRAARNLYEGRFLEGFSAESTEFEAWQTAEAVRLEDLAARALAKLAERTLRCGKSDEALEA